MKETGLKLDLPDAEYRAAPGLAQSALKEFARTPAHYRAYLQAPSKQSAALRYGELVHRAVFQPDLYRDSVVTAPKVNRATKAGKEIWEEFQAHYPDKEFVTEEEATGIECLVEALHQHPETARILKAGHAEVSAWGRDDETGVLCKGRFDWWNSANIYDLKTTEDASPAAFARSATNFKYHWQAAHYLALAQAIGFTAYDFIWIVVEKSPPFGVAIYRLAASDLKRAQDERMHLLRHFAWCVERDEWPCYSEYAQVLNLPRWAWSTS